MTFSEILQDLMSEKSTNIKELSTLTKIETPTLYAYLNSNCLPSLEAAISLSLVFAELIKKILLSFSCHSERSRRISHSLSF